MHSLLPSELYLQKRRIRTVTIDRFRVKTDQGEVSSCHMHAIGRKDAHFVALNVTQCDTVGQAGNLATGTIWSFQKSLDEFEICHDTTGSEVKTDQKEANPRRTLRYIAT